MSAQRIIGERIIGAALGAGEKGAAKMFRVAKFLTGPGRRARLLAGYIFFVARRKLGLPVPNPVRIDGMTIHYGDPHIFRLTFREIFIGRMYETPSAGARRVIDAGANIGLAALFFAREHPDAHIDCFEPNPETLQLLEQNLRANGLRASIHPVGLGAADEDREFFYVRDHAGDIGHSSVRALRDVFEAPETVGSHTLPLRSLRPFLAEPVDILKMDIEGGEGEVLPAVEDLLGRVRHLVMEFHHIPGTALLGDTLAILERAGHTYELVEGASNGPGAVVAIRASLHAE